MQNLLGGDYCLHGGTLNCTDHGTPPVCMCARGWSGERCNETTEEEVGYKVEILLHGRHKQRFSKSFIITYT